MRQTKGRELEMTKYTAYTTYTTYTPAPSPAALSSTSRMAAILAALCAALSISALATLHALSPELDTTWRMVSEYALGHYGWVLSLMFLTMGLGCVALVIAIMPQMRTRGGKVGLALLLLACVGMAMASVFDITQGMHGLAALIGNTSFPAAAILISVSLSRANPAWASVRRLLLWTGNLPWVSVVVMVAFLFVGLSQTGGKFGPGVWIGWPNRILWVAYGAWVMVVAVRVARMSRSQKRSHPTPDASGANDTSVTAA